MTAEQIKELENRLWQAADKLRADSNLKSNEYATPVLGFDLPSVCFDPV